VATSLHGDTSGFAGAEIASAGATSVTNALAQVEETAGPHCYSEQYERDSRVD
jgi:hypothetical protein